MGQLRRFGLLICLGLIGVAAYVYLADRYCPIDAPSPGFSPLDAVGDHREEGDGQAGSDGGGGHNRHFGSPIPSFFDLTQAQAEQFEGQSRSSKEYDKSPRWITKFVCEAKISDISIAFFTYCLVIVTGWLVSATVKLWESAQRQEVMARTHERAYIFGGGPANIPNHLRTAGDDADVCATIENFGRTPGFIKRFDWGLCDEKDFVSDVPVRRLIEDGLLRDIVIRVDHEDVYPPGQPTRHFQKAKFNYSANKHKIFFGLFLYRDVFGDWHHSTFKLRLGGDVRKMESDPLPGCYSDWS